MLLEHVGNVDLLTLVQSGQDDQATEIAGGVMQKLYAAKFIEPGLL